MPVGFCNGSYATVWEKRPSRSGKTTSLRITVSSKDRVSDAYKDVFQGWVTAASTAHEKAAKLGERERIRLKDCNVTNTYDKEKNENKTFFTIYDLEVVQSNAKASASDDPEPIDSGDDELF